MSAQSRRIRRRVSGVCIAGAVLAAQGCGHFGILVKKEEKQSEPESVNTSLTALAADRGPVEPSMLSGSSAEQPTVSELNIEESARLLEQYLEGIENAPPADEPETVVAQDSETSSAPPIDPVADAKARLAEDTSSSEQSPGVSFSLSDAQDDAGDGSNAVSEDSAESDEPDPNPERVEVDPQIRKAELIDELKALLASTTRAEQEPAPSAVALAALDALGPGTLESLYEEGVLSSAEMTTLSAARDVLRSIASSGSIASPGEVSDVLERVSRELDTSSGMRVTRATLCTSVSGFGLYDEFPSMEFLAGVPHEMIVYVEVDRFAHKEVLGEASEPRYDVEMSQRLELYHVADDVNTWNRAAEQVTERSRNKVRDFYLTNYVVLPATLRAGSYHLKVVMRDLVGGTVAERIIPLRIVAR